LSSTIKEAVYKYLLALSIDFYNNKSSRELIKAIDQGKDITRLLEQTVFLTGPIVLDFLIVVVYLLYTLDIYIVLDFTIVAVLYIYIILAENSWISVLQQDFSQKEYNKSRIWYKSIQN
jgi:ABC-type transport system involved in Fe-S cluster assembly fused permease/ATPase subunit